MEDIEDNVRSRLIAWPTLLPLIGKDSTGTPRVYPQELPQGKTNIPAIVFHEIDSQSVEDVSGSSGMGQTRFQFDCIADDVSIAKQMREEVRQCFQGYRGTLNGQWVHGVSVAGRFSRYESPLQGSPRGRYVRIIDLLFSHEEAT